MSPEPTTGADVAGTTNVGMIVPGVSGTANVGVVVPGVTVLGITEPGGAAFTRDCVGAVDGAGDGASLGIAEGVALGRLEGWCEG
jgi:hypothetical protein